MLFLVTVWHWVFHCGSLDYRGQSAGASEGKPLWPLFAQSFPKQTQQREPGMLWPQLVSSLTPLLLGALLQPPIPPCHVVVIVVA